MRYEIRRLPRFAIPRDEKPCGNHNERKMHQSRPPLTREAWVLPHQCLFRGNDKLGALYLLSNILYPISPISHPVLSKIDTGMNSQLPGNTKNVSKIMQNARKTMAHHGFLGISYIKSPKNLYKLTLSPESKIWYVIRGVLWVYCAHGARRFFRGTRSPSGAKKSGVYCIVRSVSAGGWPHFPGDGGGDPVGFPQPIRKRIILKEL